jgi:DNA-binding transcriptional LysR family regulator
MELIQLKYFKTVAQTGKISDAAQALFISAPALSTSISRLEKELGVQLFNRTNNKIVLNRQGKIFLKYVNQIFSDLESAKKELR